MVPTTVISVPRSADVIASIYFVLRLPIILSGLRTVATPVSSMFQMSKGLKLCLFKTNFKVWKKELTLFLLKLLALAKLALSGVQNDNWRCLSKKDVSQSGPACCLSHQLFRISILLALTNL